MSYRNPNGREIATASGVYRWRLFFILEIDLPGWCGKEWISARSAALHKTSAGHCVSYFTGRQAATNLNVPLVTTSKRLEVNYAFICAVPGVFCCPNGTVGEKSGPEYTRPIRCPGCGLVETRLVFLWSCIGLSLSAQEVKL